MTRYAAQTSVSTEKTRNEIERTLKRYGADRFAYVSEPDKATIAFEMKGRRDAAGLAGASAHNQGEARGCRGRDRHA